MLSTDHPSDGLRKAFEAFVAGYLPLKPLTAAQERVLLEMSAAHYFWAADRSKYLEEVLVVSSIEDLYEKVRDMDAAATGWRPRSARDLSHALNAGVLFPLRRQASREVMEFLLRIADELITGPVLDMDKVRRAACWNHSVIDPAGRELHLALDLVPYIESLQFVFVAAFLAEQFHGTVRSLEGFLQLALRSPFFGWYDRTFVVCRAPAAVHCNARGRLHRTDGLAVVFQDGTGMALVDGVRIPARYFGDDYVVTAADIIQAGNMEVRRVLMERMGIDAFLDEIDAQPIAHDDFGVLYHSFFEPDEWGDGPDDQPFAQGEPRPRAYVKLLNSTPEPGTTDVFKEYLLRVPPDVRTPRDAVAWSFDLDEQAYAPLAET